MPKPYPLASKELSAKMKEEIDAAQSAFTPYFNAFVIAMVPVYGIYFGAAYFFDQLSNLNPKVIVLGILFVFSLLMIPYSIFASNIVKKIEFKYKLTWDNGSNSIMVLLAAAMAAGFLYAAYLISLRIAWRDLSLLYILYNSDVMAVLTISSGGLLFLVMGFYLWKQLYKMSVAKRS